MPRPRSAPIARCDRPGHRKSHVIAKGTYIRSGHCGRRWSARFVLVRQERLVSPTPTVPAQSGAEIDDHSRGLSASVIR